MFVDRLKELRTLKLVAEALKKNERTNVAIIGNRRIGKTELLLEFKDKSHHEKTLIFPYLNVQRVGDINSFIFSAYS
jgi:AAA+ ATPase superfamily predicted ATPase